MGLIKISYGESLLQVIRSKDLLIKMVKENQFGIHSAIRQVILKMVTMEILPVIIITYGKMM